MAVEDDGGGGGGGGAEGRPEAADDVIDEWGFVQGLSLCKKHRVFASGALSAGER